MTPLQRIAIRALHITADLYRDTDQKPKPSDIAIILISRIFKYDPSFTINYINEILQPEQMSLMDIREILQAHDKKQRAKAQAKGSQ